MLKRSLVSGISSSAIDECYDRAALRARPAASCWRGGGGFLMFFAPPDRHGAIERALPGLRKVEFHFEPRGSRIILFH